MRSKRKLKKTPKRGFLQTKNKKNFSKHLSKVKTLKRVSFERSERFETFRAFGTKYGIRYHRRLLGLAIFLLLRPRPTPGSGEKVRDCDELYEVHMLLLFSYVMYFTAM